MSMVDRISSWLCTLCEYRSKDAPVDALNDFYLLLAPIITNKQAKNFLRLRTDEEAKYLLKKLNYPCVGEKRGRFYTLEYKELDQ